MVTTNYSQTKKRITRYEVVANKLRKSLQTLEIGDMLPPERDLASQYNVSYMTVRRALQQLSEEGYIKRYQGRGTVVVDRLAAGEIAIVVKPRMLRLFPYYQIASSHLMEQLKKTCPRWKVEMHLGHDAPSGKIFSESLDLLDPEVRMNLRGVFAFHPLYDISDRLRQANIPVITLSFSSKDHSPYRVWFDYQNFYEVSLNYLREKNCKSVGLLWSGNPKFKMFNKMDDADLFRQIADNLNLQYNPQWIVDIDELNVEQAGYENFMKIWESSDRPKAILVNDDILCRGVLRAILQLGIKTPEDLMIISQANDEAPFPFHLSVTRFEFSISQQIEHAVNMMSQLVKGQDIEEPIIALKGTLIKGHTA